MKNTFICMYTEFLCYFLMILKKLRNVELSINLPTFITLVKTRSVTYFLEIWLQILKMTVILLKTSMDVLWRLKNGLLK